MSLVETGKSQLAYIWLKTGTFQRKLDKKLLFCQDFQPLYEIIQKEIENLKFVHGVKFEVVDSLKNSGKKFSLIFDDFCENICNSKAFVDFAATERHLGLSTVYIEPNLFHQGKLGRDVELQSTHIVLFKSRRCVMQVSTLSAQLGVGPELVDWYRQATSVPYGHV